MGGWSEKLIHEKKIGLISKILAFTGLAFGIVFGILYLKLAIPSERELWRITDNDMSDPIIVNKLLLFVGNKGENISSSCQYIYAIDKNTGEAVWSSESLTNQFCDHSSGPVFTAIIPVSGKEGVIFVNSSYWITDDEQKDVFYALSSSDGKLLWKVDGYAGHYPPDYSAINTNYLYVVSKEGSLSAIDNSTGSQIWKQEIPKVDDYGTIEYYRRWCVNI